MRSYMNNRLKENAVDNFNLRMLGLGHGIVFQNKLNSARSLVARLQLTEELAFHGGCVNAVNFSSSGDLIVSGSDDMQVAVWDWLNCTKAPKVSYDSGHSSNVFQAKFMPNTNDSTVVTCARDGQVRVGFLTSANKIQQTKSVARHKGAAHRLSIETGSPNVLKTAGEDAVVFNIDLRESKPNKLLTLHSEKNRKIALYSIDINPSNPLEFAVAGRDCWARIYDMRKITQDRENGVVKKFCPDHLKITEGLPSNITCLMYSYNGTELICSYNDEDIYLFDASHSSGSNHVHKYKGHRNSDTVKGVNFFGPCSEYIVSGSDCSHVFIWDKKTEEVVTFLQGDSVGVVNVLEPHPTCCILATAGLDHDIKVWQPTGDAFHNTEGLNKQIKENESARVDDRNRGTDHFDNHLIILMMRHLQQRRRRLSRRLARERGELEEESDTTESSEDSDNTTMEYDLSGDSSLDGDDDTGPTGGCVQS